MDFIVQQAKERGAQMNNEASAENQKKLQQEKQNEVKQKKERNKDIDAELEMLLAKHRATIKVVGAGGGGNNTINRIAEVGIEGAETIAMNTDAQDLLYTTADKKILLGRELTGGLGAGSVPRIGEESAKESEHEIKQALIGADMVFITCGLGGGIGIG